MLFVQGYFMYSIGQILIHLPWIIVTFIIMVTSCVAYGCTNRMKKGGNISFHRFRHNKPDLLQKWVQAVREIMCCIMCQDSLCNPPLQNYSVQTVGLNFCLILMILILPMSHPIQCLQGSQLSNNKGV